MIIRQGQRLGVEITKNRKMKNKIEEYGSNIEMYITDANDILNAKNSEELNSVIQNSQTGISSVYEGGMDEIKAKLKEAGLKTNFDEQQNYILAQYIGFNLQTIIFDEFFPTVEGEVFSLDKIPNLLAGGEQGDDTMKCVRFLKFIGLVGKSMFAVSNVASSTEIIPMETFIANLNESTIIGHSWNSPLIGVFPPKDAAFFTKLYATKDWKKKFHQRCVNVVNEMLNNIRKFNN
jgi:hypothetical protein